VPPLKRSIPTFGYLRGAKCPGCDRPCSRIKSFSRRDGLGPSIQGPSLKGGRRPRLGPGRGGSTRGQTRCTNSIRATARPIATGQHGCHGCAGRWDAHDSEVSSHASDCDCIHLDIARLLDTAINFPKRTSIRLSNTPTDDYYYARQVWRRAPLRSPPYRSSRGRNLI
jgi:hypothetical protein